MRYYKILNYGEVVAEQRSDGLFYPLSNNVPFSLFGMTNNLKSCTFEKFEFWLLDRMLPENRIGLKKVLKDNGIDFYDKWTIALKTKGAMPGEDGYSIEWEDR